VEGHCGYSLPWHIDYYSWLSFNGGAAWHDAHHKGFNYNFGEKWLDILFGTDIHTYQGRMEQQQRK
jgi:sterol desaturase/sphingolipid hydroxylase (fatty acid hydroxylase superfamily)